MALCTAPFGIAVAALERRTIDTRTPRHEPWLCCCSALQALRIDLMKVPDTGYEIYSLSVIVSIQLS